MTNIKTPNPIIKTALDVAVSFWQGGAYEETRKVVYDTLATYTDLSDIELVSLSLILALAWQFDGEPEEALLVWRDYWPKVEACGDLVLQGKCFVSLAYSYRRTDRRDDAIIALTGACECHRRAGATQLQVEAENNLGNLLVDAKRFDEAHDRFDSALAACEDPYSRAQFLESKASAYLAEGRPNDALPFALESVSLLKGGEREPLLRESIHTLNRVCDELEKLFKRQDERPLIEAALKQTNGHVTPAARLLGMKLGSLQWKLENQYRELLPLRVAKMQPRGAHAVKKRKRKTTPRAKQ